MVSVSEGSRFENLYMIYGFHEVAWYAFVSQNKTFHGKVVNSHSVLIISWQEIRL
jgi:hypothetical protein